jgi:hypothetical protein
MSSYFTITTPVCHAIVPVISKDEYKVVTYIQGLIFKRESLVKLEIDSKKAMHDAYMCYQTFSNDNIKLSIALCETEIAILKTPSDLGKITKRQNILEVSKTVDKLMRDAYRVYETKMKESVKATLSLQKAEKELMEASRFTKNVFEPRETSNDSDEEKAFEDFVFSDFVKEDEEMLDWIEKNDS